MDWNSIKNAVSKVAPTLGTVLGGPLGGVAGQLISAALGVENNPEAIEKELVSNPDAYLKLKELEMNHKLKLQELVIESELEHRRITNASFTDARSRDKLIMQQGLHNYRADIMLAMAFLSLCFLVYMINSTDNLLPQVLAIFNMAIGALLKMIGDGFQFEFGSSRGSKLKDQK